MQIEGTVLALFACVLLWVGCGRADGAVTQRGILNHEREPFTHIIVNPREAATVQFAARELQRYLKEVCGAALPIVAGKRNDGPPILVGASEELGRHNLSGEELRADEFRIISDGKMLAIFGKDYRGRLIVGHRTPHTQVWNRKLDLPYLGSVGTLFGVYRFLEKYAGVRWYMPGQAGTVLPKRDRIVLPELDESSHPCFHYRFAHMAVSIIDNQELSLWYRRLGFGGSPNIEINHSFGAGMGKYRETNPEYFALVDGERDVGTKCAVGGGGPQLCLTNPDVAEQWSKDIIEYFNKNPQQHSYAVVPGDVLERVCECRTCAAEVLKDGPEEKRFSNHIWRFVNAIAEKVARVHPDKFIGSLAYERYRMPPDFDIHPNAVVMFCKRRSALVDPVYRDTLRDAVNGWRKRTKNIYFWVYYLDHWMPWQNLPFAFPHVIQEDLQYMKSIGSGGEKIEAEEHPAIDHYHLGYPGMQHLNLYVTGKLQWDPDLDLEALLDEYYTLFYGPAREEMRTFWEYVERNYAGRTIEARERATAKAEKDGPPPAVHTQRVKPIDVFPEKVMNKLGSMLDAALAKADPDSLYHQRIKVIRGEFVKGRSRVLASTSDQRTELVLPGPVTVEGGNIPYSGPAPFMDNLNFISPPHALRTEAFLAWDNDRFYMRFVCYENRIKHIEKACTRRDDGNLWRDDCVEIFLSPDRNDPGLSYQFIVNPVGTLWDGKYERTSAAKAGWASGVEATASIHDDRWTAEVRIPLRDLGLDGNALSGKAIGANFYRNRQTSSATQYTSWSPTGVVSHYAPKKMGAIVFGEKE